MSSISVIWKGNVAYVDVLKKDSILHVIGFMRDQLHAKRSFFMILDTSRIESPPPLADAKLLSEFMKTSKDALIQYLKGTALHIPFTLCRLFIKAAFAIQPPSTPVQLVTSTEEGQQYIQQMQKNSNKRIIHNPFIQ